jgi:hypothetical protein
VQHAWEHQRVAISPPSQIKKTLTRAPRVKKRVPSTPFDLQTADLFKE